MLVLVIFIPFLFLRVRFRDRASCKLEILWTSKNRGLNIIALAHAAVGVCLCAEPPGAECLVLLSLNGPGACVASAAPSWLRRTR